ncbi:MAG: DUF6147 family protein [Lachnospiraceae bacterium]|nr:DUF6147 family protein [Lachnospiraceae bacterium]
MKWVRKITAIVLLFCMSFGTLQASAADELLGTVVDGSLLTEETEVEAIVYPSLRWSYLSNGTGTLTVTGSRTFRMAGSTTAKSSVDTIKVCMYLQRLVNGTWSNYYTGPIAAKYNAYYVSSTTSSISVAGGYYYRAWGAHVVIEGSASESVSSYTNGIWVD